MHNVLSDRDVSSDLPAKKARRESYLGELRETGTPKDASQAPLRQINPENKRKET